MGVSAETVGRWERGESGDITWERLVAVCEALGILPSEILRGAE